MFGKKTKVNLVVLAEEHGQVCGVPPKLVGESQDTEAGDLSLNGFCSGRAPAECCCVCCKVLYLNEQSSWQTYRRILGWKPKQEK